MNSTRNRKPKKIETTKIPSDEPTGNLLYHSTNNAQEGKRRVLSKQPKILLGQNHVNEPANGTLLIEEETYWLKP